MKLSALLLAGAGLLSAQTVQSLTVQIQRAPTAALYVQRGNVYLDAGDAKQAVADFDRALERDSMHVRALTLRAEAYSKLNRYGDAITDLSGAIALAPANAFLYVSRAEAYAASGDARHAQEDRVEATRLDPGILDRAKLVKPPQEQGSAPKEPPAQVPAPAPPVRAQTPKPAPAAPSSSADVSTRYQRGRDLIFKGQHSEGRAELEDAVRQEPNNSVLYNTLGFSYYSTKEYKRAIELFDRAIALNPNYVNAIRNRALARRSSGDNAGYEADHRRELELSGKQKKSAK